MHKTLLLLLTLFGLSPASWGTTTSPSKPETVLAVMDILNNTGEFASFVEGMPDMLITELLESGELKLVERTKVQTAMKALKLETSGLTQERNLELGKWLGVDCILFGAFNRAGDRFRLDVRSIDVQTGKINVSASATCGKQNILDLIPDVGKQLRGKLSSMNSGKIPNPIPTPILPIIPKPTPDSCQLELQYKMMVSLFSEAAIPHQRVRIYLDDQLLSVSGVVTDLNRYFILYRGLVSSGNHTLTLIHGSVDQEGRWVRELAQQPNPYSFEAGREGQPTIQYAMHAHEDWFSFEDFKLKYKYPKHPQQNQGE